jgi:hypothetical protein
MNTTETISCVNLSPQSGWERWTGSERCPNCDCSEVEYNTHFVLTSNPPQWQLRCKSCGHAFNSGYKPLDQISDWPPAPQVGDWPPTPTPQDPPYSPNTYNYGWICPKCGRCLAPHVDSCPCFNEVTLSKDTL